MTYPLWATPERQAHLVELFYKSKGFCVYDHPMCHNPDHHYENYIEIVIGYWKDDDREARSEVRRIEGRVLHPEGHRWGRQFDSVERERFFAKQPSFYLETVGISGLTFKRIAKVRIPSSFTRLHVEIGKATQRISKNARRKHKRYGLLASGQTIDHICQQAVDDYWDNLGK